MTFHPSTRLYRTVFLPVALFALAPAAFTIAVLTIPESRWPIRLMLILSPLAALLALTMFRHPVRWLLTLLVLKPIIDLTWRWELTDIIGQRLNPQAVIAAVATLLALIALWRRDSQLRLPFVLMAFPLLCLLSVSANPTSQGINELVRLWSGIAMLVVGPLLIEEEKRNIFAGQFLLVVTVPVVLSFAQVAGLLPFEYWDWTSSGRLGRASGTYQHPLNLVFFAVCAIPLAFSLAFGKDVSRLLRVFALVFIPTSLIATMFTFHRTGLLVLGVQIIILLLLLRKYSAVIILAILAIATMVILQDQLLWLYGNIISILQGNVDLASSKFLRGRGAMWYLFLESFMNASPLNWLIGFGGSHAEGLAPGFGYIQSEEPHSDFVRILYAYGIIGIFAYLLILTYILRCSLFIWRSDIPNDRHLGSVTFVITVGMIILSITTEPMRFPSASWYLFAFGSAVISRCYRLRRWSEDRLAVSSTKDT